MSVSSSERGHAGTGRHDRSEAVTERPEQRCHAVARDRHTCGSDSRPEQLADSSQILIPSGLEARQSDAYRVYLRQRAERIESGDQRAPHVLGAHSATVQAKDPWRARGRARVALTCERDPDLRLAGVHR